MLIHLTKMNSPLLDQFRTPNGYRLWQPGGGHDLNIWTMKKAIEKAEYCHGNPVKRRLVRSAELWRWSSFRWLIQGKREDEPLRVDDWDERLEQAPLVTEPASPSLARCAAPSCTDPKQMGSVAPWLSPISGR